VSALGRSRPPRPRRRLKPVLQATVADCAPACLAAVLDAYRRPVPVDRLRDELGAGRDGVRAVDVRDLAEANGLTCRAKRVPAERLGTVVGPSIAHWEGNHFVVVERVGRRRVTVMDPAIGRRRLGHDEVAAAYSGVVLVFAARPDPQGTVRRRPVPAWRRILLPVLLANRRALALLGLAAVGLLLAGLATPAITSWLVTRLTPAAATAPGAIAVGPAVVAIGVLALAVAALALTRGLAAAGLQQRVGRDLTGSVVDRLLAAPLLFFEQRGSGEVVSRTLTADAVRDVVATQLVAAVLDAAAAVGYLAVVCVLDARVGAVTAALAAALVAALLVTGRHLRRSRREELLALMRCHAWLHELVGGIAWLKAAGAERVAHDRWSDLHERRLAALARSSRLDALADTAASVVRVAGPLLVLAVAVAGAAAAGSDVGRPVGVSALATAALLPFSALAAHLQVMEQLGSLIAHLDDLVSAPQEQHGDGLPVRSPASVIEARGVGFRYSRRAPDAVAGIDLHVPAGGKLAVVGASGSGKSTLARLLVGLYRPSEGDVCLDGERLDALDLVAARRRFGVVLQEPFLITGTVRDNIALCDSGAELPRVMAAARLAAIDEEIGAMPLGYATLITEGGVGLSGGQRQRIALARALLADPGVLVLDEATSHLDPLTEACIEANLRDRGTTRVVIAHRLSTVRDADQIVVLDGGRIVERGDHDSLVAAGGRYARMVLAQSSGLVGDRA
jgi:ATP-binding cassette, subfamily B, bacterial